ncbi:MAG: nitroreductase family protein [Flavobacteriales bacterium]|nr:nitroreductase family protein [Flavobacteriales bacterium]
MENSEGFQKYEHVRKTEEVMSAESLAYYLEMNKRRSIRNFSLDKFDIEIIKTAIKTANTAPSGANKQPWFYAIVQSSEIKKQIREAAEKEEFENYHGRMSDEWLDDLKKFGTNHIKEFLEIAPYLVVVFKQVYGFENGQKQNNYYVNESVGISVGMFLSAIHKSGLVALTHTPSPMNFLAKVLDRPENERAYLLIPVGYPSVDVQVPMIKRKSIDDVSRVY